MPSVDKPINTSTCLRGKAFVQKHLNHVSAVAIPTLGINPSLRLRFYCRTRACMLCMFVLPPISLIKVVNSGSFHWALSVFIYYRFMLAFRVQFAGDVNQKISPATTALSNTFARFLLGLIHWIRSCPLQLSIFFNLINIRLNVFFKQWVCIEHWI